MFVPLEVYENVQGTEAAADTCIGNRLSFAGFQP